MTGIEMPKSAIELIHQRPQMFFEGGRATMSELISSVMRDVASYGDVDAAVLRKGAFTMVSANVDWLKTGNGTIPELFDRFVLPNEKRPNAFRSEVLLNAVSEGVLTIGADGVFGLRLSVDDLPVEMFEASKSAARSVIWKFAG